MHRKINSIRRFVGPAVIVPLLIVLSVAESAEGQKRRRELPTEPKGGRTIDLAGVPQWLKRHDFDQDKFTFVRIRYDGIGRRRGAWATDFPNADLNPAAQFGSLTKLDVSEPVRVLRLTDPALKTYRFAYLAEPGTLQLDSAEVKALREYLNGGGFLMVDDFWGEHEWSNLRSVMQKVLPDRQPRELPLTHPLFHCVFDLQEMPQVTSISRYLAGLKTERPDATAVHYRAYVDDDDRILVLMCHNTDLADGWERIGEDERYTLEMSKKRALPMGINIVFYALSRPTRN